MAEQDACEQARLLRSEAGRLLYDEGLLDVVKGFGPVQIIGSYALDLMAWPDLDINVQLADELDVGTFFDLGRAIATKFQAIKMSFSNQFIRPDVPFDHGLYWGIRLIYGEQTWKLDLWGYGAQAFRESEQAFERLQRALESADRLAILDIKNAVCRRPTYRVEVSSMDIYEAVADHGVRTIEQFDDWLRRRVGREKRGNLTT